ncbi:FkbM family methyltransferase [uncultured Desulfosarcina sp.]|uniref:FkbM family methyltransferase n=1 Tax=uncultured Desulfosarcina sp. TaxID=218289 RepID=UPI0029C9329C|nr:FkbM family methyltransferase [uncultured Desulfosarcina sp.]
MIKNKMYYFDKMLKEFQGLYRHIYIYGADKRMFKEIYGGRSNFPDNFIKEFVFNDLKNNTSCDPPTLKQSNSKVNIDEAVVIAPTSFEKEAYENAKAFFGEHAKIYMPYHQFFLEPHKKIKGERKEDLFFVPIEESELKFWCPSNICKNRVDTFFTKEPETIEWIDTFPQCSTFWDIGANIGLYSLYAALKSHKIFSFEPEASNYYALNRNINVNKMQSVNSYCLAFTNKDTLGSLYLSAFGIGKALHSFDDRVPVDGNKSQFDGRQASIGLTIDSFMKLFSPPAPNYIKIDVDGNEEQVLLGARNTLERSNVDGIMVELDITQEEKNDRIFQLLSDCGLILDVKLRSPMFDNHRFSNNYNHFFYRKHLI